MSDDANILEIEGLAQRCVAHVRGRFGVDPDFTSDTLSIVDHYVVALLGAHFGETLRKEFGGRWRFQDKAPQDWRFEFDTFFLRFNPVGAAANVLARNQLADWGSELRSAPAFSEGLAQRFAAVPAVAEDDFFSFGNYFESIQIAQEYLLAVGHKDGRPDCSPAGYDRIFFGQ